MKKQENAKDRKIRNQRKEIERLSEENKKLKGKTCIFDGHTFNLDWEINEGNTAISVPKIEVGFEAFYIPTKGMTEKCKKAIEKAIDDNKKVQDKAVFTNCLGEDFTEGWMVKNFYYCVRKSNLRVYKLNGLSYQLRGNESWSECFKTEESAEKWKEQYKTNKLKDGFVFDEDEKEFRELGIEEISYKIDSLNSLNHIYSCIPKDSVLYIRTINDIPFALFSNRDTQTHCISEEAFIRIMNNKK